MMSPREQWTDERLDDLSTRVDHGFVRMEARFDRMEARMDQRFEHMEERFDARFDALWRTMIGSAAVIIAALIGVIATQL